ncbi:MAG: hypothetical protein KatS3mg102_2567 [Planctomycetota bacterium]|nr:MAG: hypothetical protein KatS3mg102_2567 [Planctomycetota bacterium]
MLEVWGVHNPAEVFLEIARAKQLLSDRQLAELRDEIAQATGGQLVLVQRLCLERGWLDGAQVRALDRAVHYYVVRKADKLYGRIAVERGFVAADVVRNCLNKQRRDYERRRTLVRLSRLLHGLDAISPEQDAAVRAAVIARLVPEEPADEREPAAAHPPRQAARAPRAASAPGPASGGAAAPRRPQGAPTAASGRRRGAASAPDSSAAVKAPLAPPRPAAVRSARRRSR